MKTARKALFFAAAVAVVCLCFAAFAGFGVREAQAKTTPMKPSASADKNASVVYMTREISPEALVRIYKALDFDAAGKTAVKISTGESQRSNHLRPALIKDLVQSVNGTLVECNTAYGGNRATLTRHWQQIKQRGYLDIAPVDLLDKDGDIAIPVSVKNPNISKDYVGKHIDDYDSLICLAHFKGHAMAGYGGAIKNMSIGFGSSRGKTYIHTAGQNENSWQGGTQDGFLESMAEACSAVIDRFEGKVVYINVMNNMSIDCDCNGNPAKPTIHDMGILASYDPVALDKACLDLIYNHVAESDENTQTFIDRVTSRNGLHTLEYGEKIGLGSQKYTIKSIDK